jgi:2-desacetyl-2-hydroxyethyl bacteriochlorophyllide A dehydrogenase
VPDPAVAAPGDAVVRVRVAGLCGSDLHPYLGREAGLDVGTVLGHEFVGVVEEVGPKVTGLGEGDRVVAPFTTSCGRCFFCGAGLTARCARGELFGWVEGGRGLHGAQAEFVRVPLADTTLVKVPEALDDDAVALLAGDILSTALFGVALARVAPGEAVAVVGCGPVGLLTVRAALEKGAAMVLAVDPVASRREAAEVWGAVPVAVDPDAPRGAVQRVRDLTAGRGADAAVEAVGTPEATRTAADLLRPGGRLAAVGVHTEAHLALSPTELYDRNLTYAAGRCPARHHMPAALRLAARDRNLLRTLITHRLPLDDAPEAYRRFAAREPGMHKVVLRPATRER